MSVSSWVYANSLVRCVRLSFLGLLGSNSGFESANGGCLAGWMTALGTGTSGSVTCMSFFCAGPCTGGRREESPRGRKPEGIKGGGKHERKESWKREQPERGDKNRK